MAGLQTNVFAGVGITWAAAFLVLIMRIIARRITKVSWWYDDYFCLSAFVWASGYCGIMMEWTIYWSLGQYMPESLDEQARQHILQQSRFLAFFNSLTYAFSIASSKLAILLFYWRLFRLSSIRIPIQVMLVLSVMWLIVRTFMLIFHCTPVQAYWDKTIPNATCKIKDSQFFFGTVLTHFLMDVAILVLPVIEVFRLRLRLGQKLAIVALFFIGSIVCLASIFVIVESLHYNADTEQMPHDYALNCTWGAVELNIAIVSGKSHEQAPFPLAISLLGALACFPLLRPIFRRILPARFLSSHGSSQPISGPSHAIRLTTLTRTRKEKEADETSSTHQLADSENGVPDMSDFDTPTLQSQEGVHTVISSRYHGASQHQSHMPAGIYVQNDMVVEVQKTEHGATRGKRTDF